MTEEEGAGQKAPGTMSSEDVKDEFRKFKEKLLNAPAAVSGIAKVAADAGNKLAEDLTSATEKVQAAAKTPDAVLAQLQVVTGRLDAIEAKLEEILARLPASGESAVDE